MDDYARSLLPLTPAALHILLALSAEQRHGYGIMQEIARQSEGQYKPGPATLYDNLQKLLDTGLVAEVQRKTAEADERRRYYRLSALGRRVLSAEIRRLEGVVRAAKTSLGKTATGRA